MENMKWNKLTARPLDEEEKEYYNSKEYKKLKELLGHTKLEVFIGFLTGIILTIILY